MNAKRQLEWQADCIEAVLSAHKVAARVTGGTVTPRWVRFTVLPAVGAKVSTIKSLDEEIARALAVETVRVSRRGAAVAVEVARSDPQPVRLLPMLRQLRVGNGSKTPHITAALGLAEDGAPLLIRLPSPDVAHILVAGTTGSGKTVLLRSMALSLALNDTPARLALVLIDPRGGAALGCFEGLPHLVRPVIREVDEALEALAGLVRLMEQRDRRQETTPAVVIVIDELADLLQTGGAEAEDRLTRIVQRGRGAGLHVVAATQKPTVAVVGSLVKANFPVRLVGKVMSSEDARTATGWSGTGAERLQGRGDFLAVAEGRVLRFQAAHVSEEEIAETLAAMGAPARSLPRVQVAYIPEVDVIELPPPPEAEPSEVEVLAQRLATWWSDHGGEWGAKTGAVRYLFGDDAPAGGVFWDLTMDAIARVEAGEISTSTSTKDPHDGGNGKIKASR